VLFNPLERLVLNNQAVLTVVEEGKLAIPYDEICLNTPEGFQLFSNWVIARNSDQRRRAREALKRFSERDFPDSYNTLGRIFDAQQVIFHVQSKGNFAQLSHEIGVVYEIPANFSIEFYFGAHEFENASEYQKFKEELPQKLSKAFVRGERNIVFLEDAGGSKTSTRARFIEGFRKYKSFRKAEAYEAIYDDVLEQDGVAPDDSTVEFVQANMDISHLKAPKSGFSITLFEVLDQFIQEGYDIEVEIERSFKDAHNYEELEAISRNAKTPEQRRGLLAVLAKDFRTRNVLVAEQITEVASDAVKRGGKTNLLVIFGSLHYEILDVLPDVLKPIAKRNEEVANDFMDALYEVLGKTDDTKTGDE